jgi:hypothetical protein
MNLYESRGDQYEMSSPVNDLNPTFIGESQPDLLPAFQTRPDAAEGYFSVVHGIYRHGFGFSELELRTLIACEQQSDPTKSVRWIQETLLPGGIVWRWNAFPKRPDLIGCLPTLSDGFNPLDEHSTGTRMALGILAHVQGMAIISGLRNEGVIDFEGNSLRRNADVFDITMGSKV